MGRLPCHSGPECQGQKVPQVHRLWAFCYANTLAPNQLPLYCGQTEIIPWELFFFRGVIPGQWFRLKDLFIMKDSRWWESSNSYSKSCVSVYTYVLVWGMHEKYFKKSEKLFKTYWYCCCCCSYLIIYCYVNCCCCFLPDVTSFQIYTVLALYEKAHKMNK